MASDVAWFRVGDTGMLTVQAAIDAALAAGGGVVYAPGRYEVYSTIQIPATPNPTKPLILRGDGPGVSQLGIPLSGGGPYDVLNVQRSNVQIEQLTLGRQAASTIHEGGRGIVIGGGATKVEDVAIRDCIVRWTWNQALSMSGPVRNVLIERSVFSANDRLGLVRVGSGCRGIKFRDCTFDFFVGNGIELVDCDDVSIIDGHVDSPNQSTGPYVLATDARNCHLASVWFEESASATATQWFIDLGRGCHGWTIVGCNFVRKVNVGSAGILKLARLGVCSGEPGGPVLGALLLNPFVKVLYSVTSDPRHIEINDSSSEVCIVGGVVEDGVGAKSPLNISDSSSKSTWIGTGQWRLPLVGTSETSNSGKLGDLVARAGRGLEAWNARSTGPSWIPASVNRYANEEVLKEIPASSKNRGTLAWVDATPAGTSNLRVWDGSAWRGVTYA